MTGGLDEDVPEGLAPGSAYVLKLGPLGTGRGRRSAYLAFTAEGAPVPPVLAPGDARALAELAPLLEGREVLCEPRLARAGARHGFRAGPMPMALRLARAGLALSALWEPGLVDPRAALVGPLLEASVELWHQAPWKHWGDTQAFRVQVEGAPMGTREGVLLGRGHQEYGFALYERPGTVERLSGRLGQGDAEAAQAEPAIALTYEQEPAWVRSAVRAATGLARFPIPLRVTPEGLGVVGPTELVLLTAVARALAQTGPERREASGYAAFEAIRLTVHVELPAPAPLPVEVWPSREAPGRRGARRRRGQAGRGGMRASEALLLFAEPVLGEIDGELEQEELAELLLFSMSVWNAVVSEDAGERPGAVAALRAQVEAFTLGERDFVLARLDRLVRRKRRLLPRDHRVLESLDLFRRPDGDLGLRVHSRRAVPAAPQPHAP